MKFKRKNVSYSLGNLTLDDSSHAALIDGKHVRLTPTEYAIIKVLMIDQDRVISKSELLSEAVKYTPDLVEESLKVHMSNLRRKLKQAGSNVEIEAVWGIGFKLTVS